MHQAGINAYLLKVKPLIKVIEPDYLDKLKS